MTADDFFLMFISFGGFLIVATVLWAFALVADRNQNNRRRPEVRPGPDSPNASSDHGRKEPAQSGGADEFLRRFGDQTRRHRTVAAGTEL